MCRGTPWWARLVCSAVSQRIDVYARRLRGEERVYLLREGCLVSRGYINRSCGELEVMWTDVVAVVASAVLQSIRKSLPWRSARYFIARRRPFTLTCTSQKTKLRRIG